MPEIDVQVNGRSYRLACAAGEETHLLKLIEHLDTHVRALAKGLDHQQVGEAKLMLMAGLMVGDELSEALDRIEDMENATKEPHPDPGNGLAAQAVIEGATRRIEELAGRLRSA